MILRDSASNRHSRHADCSGVSTGGAERVVSYLTEELVRLGHDVKLK